LALVLAGCASKAKAKARERAAFVAGQQEILMRLEQAREPNVRVVGLVKNPVIPWTEDLTLSKAIVAARYYGSADPRQIVIVRQGQAIAVDPKSLLKGEDVPLVAGDTVELKQ